MNNPAVVAPIEFANTDDTVDFPPSQTTPTPVQVFPMSPIKAAPKTAPPSITSWTTNEPSDTDSTNPPHSSPALSPPTPPSPSSPLEVVCTPIAEDDKDAPKVEKLRVLSKGQVTDKFDITKGDGVVTIELTVREKKDKTIAAFVLVITGKNTIFKPDVKSDYDCLKNIDDNKDPVVLKCDIKLPKEAPPGTYQIEVCLLGSQKNFYSAARLEKENRTFSFKVINSERL
jgi:hypothetical protein